MSIYEAARQYKLTNQINDIHDELKDIKVSIMELSLLLGASLEYQCEVCKTWLPFLDTDNLIPAHRKHLMTEEDCQGTDQKPIGRRIKQ